MKISQRAFDLIVGEEVSSKAYYIRHYQSPEWPGGASGITIGIGYDLGYASRAKITSDWNGRVSQDMMLVMLRCSAVTGDAARVLLDEVKSAITIPWDDAIAVFANRDVPQWTSAVMRACPGADKMTSTCLGVVVSVAYNRGASFHLSGDRFIEMRAIADDIKMGVLAHVSTDIRDMKRLWPTVKGLRDRRDREAALYDQGMTTIDIEAKVNPTPGVPDPDVPTKAGPARTKPPATTTAQHTTAGGIVVGSVTAAHQAGFSLWQVVLVGVASAAVASVVWWLWYRNRNPK